MSAMIRVECIRKPDRSNPHRHITHIGGRNADGTRWLLTEEDAIRGIRQGTWSFYVHVGSHTVAVVIARSAQGHDYLKTEADGYRPDNLLALPECP
jgi:hypothetical protein